MTKKNYCQRWKSPIREQLWYHRKTKYLLSNHCSPQNEARYSGAVRITYSIYLKRNEPVAEAVDYDLWKIDHTESLNTMKAKCDASQSIEKFKLCFLNVCENLFIRIRKKLYMITCYGLAKQFGSLLLASNKIITTSHWKKSTGFSEPESCRLLPWYRQSGYIFSYPAKIQRTYMGISMHPLYSMYHPTFPYFGTCRTSLIMLIVFQRTNTKSLVVIFRPETTEFLEK